MKIDIVCPKCFGDYIAWRVQGSPSTYCKSCGHEWEGIVLLRRLIEEHEEKRNINRNEGGF